MNSEEIMVLCVVVVDMSVDLLDLGLLFVLWFIDEELVKKFLLI